MSLCFKVDVFQYLLIYKFAREDMLHYGMLKQSIAV